MRTDSTLGRIRQRFDDPAVVDLAAGALFEHVLERALEHRQPGAEADRLVSIKTPVAARPEVHAMEEEGGFMKMRSARNSSSSRDLLEAAQHAKNHEAQ
jgi:hypothetical protein